MTLVSVVVGLLVAPVVATAVYLDGTRRRRPTRECVAWAVGTGAAALGGFLLAPASGGPVFRAYERLVRPEPPVVVVTPFELLGVHLAVGGVVTVVGLVAYGVATRAR